ncbi:MAG: hypothetical protein FD123_4336 [Bacteroidetes bacterium]|nr:MAG: hypothetical protein FD123_4336 [Bacteroidota bacterium]
MKQSWIVGASGGVLILVLSILDLKVIHDGTGYLRYGILLIYFAMIYLAVMRTRDRDLGGEITFKQALRAGMIGAIASSLITAPFWFWFFRYELPLSQLKYSTVKPLPYQFRLITEDSVVAIQYTINSVIMNLLMGFIVALVAGIFLRKKDQSASI